MARLLADRSMAAAARPPCFVWWLWLWLWLLLLMMMMVMMMILATFHNFLLLTFASFFLSLFLDAPTRRTNGENIATVKNKRKI